MSGAGEEVVSFLEMTAPSDLVPARPPPSPIAFDEVAAGDVSELRRTHERVGRPHAWRGRRTWGDTEWHRELERPGVRAWIVRIDGEAAGVVELELVPDGEVGVAVFGLVPEFVGRGCGGAALETSVRIAWSVGEPTRRVWLQTSTRDHPHALPNYLARGFRVERAERRPL